MEKKFEKCMFDPADYHLLEIIRDIRNRQKKQKDLRQRIGPYLHPRGIKEMAAPRELRMAYAIGHLLDSLDEGRVEDRLTALQSLVDEVMNSTEGNLRKNTARVLLQLMKELIRCDERDTRRQLALAHDFRRAAVGRPRVIRKLLSHYHLLEMPEEWNQVSFDDHVHDANTKGRKNPCHLIMDAWIKGIREIRVIYYNHIPKQALAELMNAAAIMGIKASIGIEYEVFFRGRMVSFIWAPAGLDTADAMVRFFSLPEVDAFMEKGRAVSSHRSALVLKSLHHFNRVHRPAMERELGIPLPEVREKDFLAMVGLGQPSTLHLSAYLHRLLTGALNKALSEVEDSRQGLPQASPLPEGDTGTSPLSKAPEPLSPGPKNGETNFPAAALSAKRREILEKLTPEMIEKDCLLPENLPPAQPDEKELPELLTLSPETLCEKLSGLHPSFSLTLNLKHLRTEDVAELLFLGQGRITHLEIFNLKDQAMGKALAYKEINALQLALNQGNIITLKRMLTDCCHRLEECSDSDARNQSATLENIISQLGHMVAPYAHRPLKTRIGTDSTGNSPRFFGMGLVLRDTLPFRTRRYLHKKIGIHHHRPGIRIPVLPHITWIPKKPPLKKLAPLMYRLRYAKILRPVTHSKHQDYIIRKSAVRLESRGNVITLGGTMNGERTEKNAARNREAVFRFHRVAYLNTSLTQFLKVAIGFIPAFLTFALTKDWWLLAYFGAVIWFVITGLRNILQSVLGGGGIRRSPLLKWHDHVRWSRVADSLLFTGFSVPLLDYVVKTRILDETLAITTSSNPIALYACMGLANGIYISTHNFFRGLPRAAVIANFFRSLLAIPVAVLFNGICGQILSGTGHGNPDEALQKWAAIISKTASDTVAGIIEGLADRFHNLALRAQDYRKKMRQVFTTCMDLELAFPKSDILSLLSDPERRSLPETHPHSGLSTKVIINALDFLYFFMYQPRAGVALKKRLLRMSEEERRIFYAYHLVLKEEKYVSTLLINGLIGKNFGPGLSFYLANYRHYLQTLSRWIPESSGHAPSEKNEGNAAPPVPG
ncbi:hypothetical protein LZ24_01179 [Desulfobotulus alkaliphilus]|uniref:Uncharacterized protein n=1 Tax=Desulfobotulus alkaliphilus TaxID=622671 RepID=A0A562RY31_9BACT|nr:hypothetical protein [Desulfobotulus alkaliphilus]TWI73949.1 hypothetical protein LZ24_01179 [Desulfobotulus alkaliphilus]